ncbi:hypothetical protein J7L67_00760 [bacterium]|nr:hypothetical protein [bacterium]
MKPILFITDANFLSHLLRCIEIAKTLRNRGEKVIFAATGIYENLLKYNQFDYYPVYTNDYNHTMKATRASMFRYYNPARLRNCVQSEIDILQKIKPKVVVGDFRWTLRISAEYCKTPYAAIINTIWTPYYSLFRSISEKMVLRKLFGRKFMEFIQPRGQKFMMYRRGRPFNRLRKKLGVTPLTNLHTEMYGEYNLLPDIPEICPAKNLPDNFKYIGPLFSKDASLPVPKKPGLPDEPYIYISLGSTATIKMIKLVFKAFENKKIPVVMTTGKQKINCQKPSNFYLFDYLSSKQAFKNADAIICHGGQGTLYQALSYGVPIIGIATHNDQQWNMDRIANLNLGIQFGEDSCSSQNIYDAYIKIGNSPLYKQNCIKMKKIIDSYDTLNLAADAIMQYAEEKEKKELSCYET